MPIPTITVTGDVLPPNNVSTGGSVLFELSAPVVDPGAGIVVPRTVSTPILANGSISVALWPNAAGSIYTRYAVYVVMPPGVPGLDEEKTLVGYAFFLTSPATQDLGDIVAQQAGPFQAGAVIYPTISDAVAAALVAASNAAQSAADAAQSANDAASWTPAFAQDAVDAANALATASLGGSISFTPSTLAAITLPSATWIITDLYASGLPQFAPDDWEQVGNQLTLKRSYHLGQRIDYRYRIAQTSTLSTSTLADGSAALPALAFANDPDTGLYRIGANILGLSTGGVERVRVSTGALTVNVPIGGVATMQTPIDTTAGRLVRVGDYGNGLAIVLTVSDNLDNIAASGFYFNATAANTPGNNYPINSSGALLVIYRSAINATQIFTTFAGNIANAANTRQFFRSRGTDGWSPWEEVLTRDTILGAVSQAAGVPTGAILQGNASTASPTGGWFERTAAGFQTAHHTITSSAAADSTWTYNSAFFAGTVPIISITPIGDSDLRPRVVSRTATSCVFSIRDVAGNRVAVPVDLIARGRWSNMT